MTKVTDIYKDDMIVAGMIDRYLSAEATDEGRASVVTELADEFGKSVPSIRSVLVRAKVYVAKATKAKDGTKIVKKFELVSQISEALPVALTESEAESLEKSTKTTLKKILAAVVVPVEDE